MPWTIDITEGLNKGLYWAGAVKEGFRECGRWSSSQLSAPFPVRAVYRPSLACLFMSELYFHIHCSSSVTIGYKSMQVTQHNQPGILHAQVRLFDLLKLLPSAKRTVCLR